MGDAAQCLRAARAHGVVARCAQDVLKRLVPALTYDGFDKVDLVVEVRARVRGSPALRAWPLRRLRWKTLR